MTGFYTAAIWTASSPAGEDRFYFAPQQSFGAPANGQWQFGWLLCIGAAGMQAFGAVLFALRKKMREDTCID
jgi:hypothetical protein